MREKASIFKEDFGWKWKHHNWYSSTAANSNMFSGKMGEVNLHALEPGKSVWPD